MLNATQCHWQGVTQNCERIVIRLLPLDKYYSQLVAAAVINIANCPVASTLNTLIVYTIYKTNSLHTISHYIICSMAISDILASFTAQPLYVIELLLASKCIGKCNLFFVTGKVILYLGTLYLLMLIMIYVDRFLAIFHPFKYQSLSSNTVLTIKILILIWILSTALAMTGLFVSHEIIDTYILLVLGPVTFIWCYYVQIRITLLVRNINKQVAKRIKNQVRPVGHEENSICSLNTEVASNTTRIAGIILLGMTFSFVPYLVLMVIGAAKPNNEKIHATLLWMNTFMLTNSTINALIYSWQLPEMRARLLKSARLIRKDGSQSF